MIWIMKPAYLTPDVPLTRNFPRAFHHSSVTMEPPMKCIPLCPILCAMLGFFACAPALSAKTTLRTVRVFVALADNAHQGIVPVPAKLGDGDRPASNLYWGAAFGVKTFFRASGEWLLISSSSGPKPAILERCVFKFRKEPVYLVADAYRGSQIRDAVTDFLSAAAGLNARVFHVKDATGDESLLTNGGSDLVVYVGHDAFMDFQIPPISGNTGAKPRTAIVLACATKIYFDSYLRDARATPLLWTTGLMAPEAYTLKAALDGWIAHETAEEIRQKAAQAYDKYQKCGLRAAQKLFATGW
jgi:hypothetical protein